MSSSSTIASYNANTNPQEKPLFQQNIHQHGTGLVAPPSPPLSFAGMPASTIDDGSLSEARLSSSSFTKAVGSIPGIAQFDRNFPRPNAIQINVEGAFIVDQDTADGRSTPGTRDIALPCHTDEVSHIAVDIGGSLAKIVYFTKNPSGRGGRLNFTKFETDKIDEYMNFMQGIVMRGDDASSTKNLHIMATGGGSYKFYDEMRSRLNVEVTREDEMDCLIAGLDFFITEIPEEVFCYSEQDPMSFAEARPNIYPYLMVNIGSGVSMVKVTGPGEFERIGGSSLGGGTLWGLLSLLTDAKSYDDMLEMADRGDNTKVDMLVGDIYGGEYSRIGLKSSTIASSFGKVFKQVRKSQSANNSCDDEELPQEKEGNSHDKFADFKGEDISRSLLYAISNNIGQIAYLQARFHKLEHIYFGGSYICGHPITMHTLSYAINFWSQGEKTAYFLRHEGYLGAVGAFLKHQPSAWRPDN